MNILSTLLGGHMDTAVLTKIIVAYKYIIIFPLACIEGPMLSIFLGFLASLGYLNPFIAYGVLFLGDLVPDTVYYSLGRFGRSRSIFQRYKMHGVARIEWFWHTHGQLTMLFTKLAYGFSVPLLATAGLAHIRFRTFLRYAIPVALSQYAILLTIGYYFGASYTQLRSSLERADLVIALGVIVFLILYFVIAKTARSYLEGK